MPKFINNRARFNAFILAEWLKSKGITRFEVDPNGDLTFRKLGATYRVSKGPSVVIEPEPRPVSGSESEPLPTSVDAFRNRGDEWNARNEQHTAFRPWRHRPRTNAFGDITDHPAVEGYEGYAEPRYERKPYTAPQRGATDDFARKLCQSRLRFQKGL